MLSQKQAGCSVRLHDGGDILYGASGDTKRRFRLPQWCVWPMTGVGGFVYRLKMWLILAAVMTTVLVGSHWWGLSLCVNRTLVALHHAEVIIEWGEYCSAEPTGVRVYPLSPSIRFDHQLQLGRSGYVVAPAIYLLAVGLLGARFGLQRRRRIGARFEPKCTHCGYSLVGNLSRVCPECGNRIVKPSVASGER